MEELIRSNPSLLIVTTKRLTSELYKTTLMVPLIHRTMFEAPTAEESRLKVLNHAYRWLNNLAALFVVYKSGMLIPYLAYGTI